VKLLAMSSSSGRQLIIACLLELPPAWVIWVIALPAMSFTPAPAALVACSSLASRVPPPAMAPAMMRARKAW
jgi:hypothetical protein